MYRFTIDEKTYNLTQLAERWKVSPSTASRIIKRVGVEKAEAFYMKCESLEGELYNNKIKVTLSDGKNYTLYQLANINGLRLKNVYYAYNSSISMDEFEKKLNKQIYKLTHKTYKLSNGCELTIGQLTYLWKVTQRSVERYLELYGIEKTEEHYVARLKRLYSKEIRERINADNSSKG